MSQPRPDRGEFYRADQMTKMKLGDNIAIERVTGETVAMTRITMSKGGKSPYHVHEDEQLLILIQGRLQVRDGEIADAAIHEMKPGDCYRAPSNVRHQVIAHEDSVFIEAFGPGPMLTSPIGEMAEPD